MIRVCKVDLIFFCFSEYLGVALCHCAAFMVSMTSFAGLIY